MGDLRHRGAVDCLFPVPSRQQGNGGLHTVFGMPQGVAWQVGIIVVVTALFLGSAVSGVHKGIKLPSQANLVLAGLLVVVMGSAVAVVNTPTNTLGAYLSDFVRMSLRLTPFQVLLKSY